MSRSPAELREALTGLLAFPVTVFRSGDLSVDLGATRDQTDWLIEQGADGIIATGATGEYFSLTPDELAEVHRACIETAAGRVPVLVGVGGSVGTAVGLAREAERLGADGLMILPSAYAPADQDGLVDYYGGIARSVDIGVVPYARDAARLEVDTVGRLAELPNVVAYKDAIADFRLWNRLRASLGDRLVWIAGAGDDLAAPYFALGATAFTSSHVNYDPAVAMFLRDLLQQGRFAEARGLLDVAIQPFFTVRARKRGYEVSVTKAAMDMRGRPGGPVRPPFVAVTEAERRLIGEALVQSATYLANAAGSSSGDDGFIAATGDDEQRHVGIGSNQR